MKISGDITRYEDKDELGDYQQPGDLFRLFDKEQKQRLFNNIAGAMQGVPMDIIERQLVHFDKADPEYGQGVRAALNNMK